MRLDSKKGDSRLQFGRGGGMGLCSIMHNWQRGDFGDRIFNERGCCSVVHYRLDLCKSRFSRIGSKQMLVAKS